MKEVTTIINRRIEESGVTLVFISKKTNIKIDTLSKTLRGARRMKADEFLKICKVLNLTFADFAKAQEAS